MNGLFDFDALPLCSYDVFSIVDGSPPTFLRTVTIAGDRAEELGDITSP
jgi:hypothetical protein